MPYINSIDRDQIQMLSLDERVEQDSEARVIDAFVSSLDLKKLGVADLEFAVDGKAALDVLEKDQSFDLVMSDMWMPVMDGAELIKRIRSDGRLAHLKVCSITADVEARTIYRDQGFDALLLKPVTIERLAELLRSPEFRVGRSNTI